MLTRISTSVGPATTPSPSPPSPPPRDHRVRSARVADRIRGSRAFPASLGRSTSAAASRGAPASRCASAPPRPATACPGRFRRLRRLGGPGRRGGGAAAAGAARRRGPFDHVDGDHDLPLGIFELERPLREQRPGRHSVVNPPTTREGRREPARQPTPATAPPEPLGPASWTLLPGLPWLRGGRMRRRRRGEARARRRRGPPGPRAPLRLTGHGSPRLRSPASAAIVPRSAVLACLAPACRSLSSLRMVRTRSEAENWIDGNRNGY